MKKNRHGLFLIVILALLIVLISVGTATYSWFVPGAENGAGVQFHQEDYIRSENCSMELYAGSKDANGVITYGENPTTVINASGTITTSGSVTATYTTDSDKTEDLRYFRILVKNADTVNASNISLFFNSLPAGTTVGIIKPTNSCHTYATAPSNVSIVRNAYVKKNVTTDQEPGTLTVDFYVRCSTTFNFNFSSSSTYYIYMLYN